MTYADIIKRLRDKKFGATQANGIAEELKLMQKLNRNNFITFDTIEQNIRNMTLNIEHKIALLKAEMLKWFIGVSLVQTSSFIATLIAALHFIIQK